MATTVTLKPNAIDLSGSTSGTTTLQATAVAGTTTITLPAATDTLVGKATTDTLTNKTLTSPTLTTPVLGTPSSGTLTNCTGLPNAGLVNSSVTVGSTAISLGGTATTVAGLTSLATNTLTSAASTALTLQSAGTTAVTIDTSQNVGIGVTPSAWTSIDKEIEIGRIGNSIYGGGLNEIALTANTYYSSGWKYAANGYANRFDVGNGNGTFAWFNAASGTAGGTPSFTQVMTIDASGNVGIGTTSPASIATGHTVLDVSAASGKSANIYIHGNGTSGTSAGLQIQSSTGDCGFYQASNIPMAFATNNTERGRFDTSGSFLVGFTSGTATPAQGVGIGGQASAGVYIGHANGTSSGNYYMAFSYNGSAIGSITQNGTTNVAYNTSSDYRLKENIQPMQNALATVAQLKPVTYKWKTDGSDGQGFIAHELQAVVPDCVTGDKDGLDDDGNPKYQGVDTSFLVATLTAAIQELKAINDTQAQTINALTARVVALEAK